VSRCRSLGGRADWGAGEVAVQEIFHRLDFDETNLGLLGDIAVNKKIAPAVILGLSFLSAFGRAWGGYDEAVAAYYNADYATALKGFRLLAVQGNKDAQADLGIMYENGYGVSKDLHEARRWYRKAAEQGNPKAQYNLGVMYAKGTGGPQDYTEAVKWYRKAAEQGDASAAFNLGSMYESGQGVVQDHIEAYAWWNIGAAKGDPAAH